MDLQFSGIPPVDIHVHLEPIREDIRELRADVKQLSSDLAEIRAELKHKAKLTGAVSGLGASLIVTVAGFLLQWLR